VSPHRYEEWLPGDWQHPTLVPIVTGHHLRPIRAADVELDMAAVMGSQRRLWSIYGEIWGWPPPTMTMEQDREDLAHHEAEIESRESFNYALFDPGESELLGCVYIEPPLKEGADAEVSWWVVDPLVDSPVEQELAVFVPQWVHSCWPFAFPRLIGLDISWPDYLALPYVAEIGGPTQAH
jgi:hypothetical protein